jgi:hypothetical protein
MAKTQGNVKVPLLVVKLNKDSCGSSSSLLMAHAGAFSLLRFPRLSMLHHNLRPFLFLGLSDVRSSSVMRVYRTDTYRHNALSILPRDDVSSPR